MAGKQYKVGVKISANGANAAAAQVSGSFAKMAVAGKAFKAEFDGVGKKLAGVGAAAAALAVSAVYGAGKFISEYTERAGELSVTAGLLGLNAEALQELRYAAEVADVPLEAFNASMGIFNKQLGMLHTAGGGKMGKFLAQVRPDLLKTLKGANGTEEAFGLVIGAMDQIHDSSKRAAFATAIFGKSGASMANLTSAELRKLREEKRKDGVITNEAAAYADDFGDNLVRLRHTIMGVGNEIGGTLLPELQPMIFQFRDWVRLNKGDIARTTVAGIRSLAEAIQSLVTVGLPKAMSLLQTIRQDWNDIVAKAKIFAALWVGGKIAAGIRGAAVAMGGLGATGGVVGAAVATGGTAATAGTGQALIAALAGPVGWAVTAIGSGIMANLYLYYSWIKGNQKNNLSNHDANAKQAAFTAKLWMNRAPEAATDEATRKVFERETAKGAKFKDLNEFTSTPVYQAMIGEELRSILANKYKITSLEQLEERNRETQAPVFVAPSVASKTEIVIRHENAPKKTRTTMKSTGPVRPKLEVHRRTDSDEEEVE